MFPIFLMWEKLLRDCSKTVTGLIFAVVYCCNLEKWVEVKRMVCCKEEGVYISLDESKESSASGLQIESDVDVLKRQPIFEEISPL